MRPWPITKTTIITLLAGCFLSFGPSPVQVSQPVCAAGGPPPSLPEQAKDAAAEGKPLQLTAADKYKGASELPEALTKEQKDKLCSEFKAKLIEDYETANKVDLTGKAPAGCEEVNALLPDGAITDPVLRFFQPGYVVAVDQFGNCEIYPDECKNDPEMNLYMIKEYVCAGKSQMAVHGRCPCGCAHGGCVCSAPQVEPKKSFLSPEDLLKPPSGLQPPVPQPIAPPTATPRALPKGDGVPGVPGAGSNWRD